MMRSFSHFFSCQNDEVYDFGPLSESKFKSGEGYRAIYGASDHPALDQFDSAESTIWLGSVSASLVPPILNQHQKMSAM